MRKWQKWKPVTLYQHIRWELTKLLASGSCAFCIMDIQEFPMQSRHTEFQQLLEDGYTIDIKDHTTDPSRFDKGEIAWVVSI